MKFFCCAAAIVLSACASSGARDDDRGAPAVNSTAVTPMPATKILT